MIKLNVELKNEQFIYSYEVGSTKHSSNCEVTPDMLKAFTEIMNHCCNVTAFDVRGLREEITAKAWIARNPEEANAELKERE